MKERLINLLKAMRKNVLTLIFAFIAVIGVGWSIYLSTQVRTQQEAILGLTRSNDNRASEIADLAEKNTQTEIAKNALQLSNNNLANLSAGFALHNGLFQEAIGALAAGMDELDALLLSDDHANRTLIKWLLSNGQYNIYDGSMAMVLNKANTWEAHMKESDAKYAAIKNVITSSLVDIKERQDLLDEAIQELENEAPKQNI